VRHDIDPKVGVRFVDVEDEPDHKEQLCNAMVRVYRATIRPGGRTLYHRHCRDTVYVVAGGGTFRSEEPGRPRQHTSVGRSVPRIRQLGWLLRKKLLGSTSLPDGTVLVQHHGEHPLVHRVCAAPHNGSALQLVGVELRQPSGATEPPPDRFAGSTLEYRDPRCAVYRIRIGPMTDIEAALRRPTVIVGVHGSPLLGESVIAPAEIAWLDADAALRLHNHTPDLAECIAVTLA
jgi:hypothetical protein